MKHWNLHRKTKYLVNTFLLIVFSTCCFCLYQAFKPISLNSTKEAIVYLQQHIKLKRSVPPVCIPVVMEIQYFLNPESFMARALQHEPCAAGPQTTLHIYSPNFDSKLKSWTVMFPLNDSFASVYFVNEKGDISRSYYEASIFSVAQRVQPGPDVYLNWPPTIQEHLELIKKARAEGSQATYGGL